MRLSEYCPVLFSKRLLTSAFFVVQYIWPKVKIGQTTLRGRCVNKRRRQGGTFGQTEGSTIDAQTKEGDIYETYP